MQQTAAILKAILLVKAVLTVAIVRAQVARMQEIDV